MLKISALFLLVTLACTASFARGTNDWSNENEGRWQNRQPKSQGSFNEDSSIGLEFPGANRFSGKPEQRDSDKQYFGGEQQFPSRSKHYGPWQSPSDTERTGQQDYPTQFGQRGPNHQDFPDRHGQEGPDRQGLPDPHGFPGPHDFPGHDGFPGQHGFPGPHDFPGHDGFPGQHGFPGPHDFPGHDGFPGQHGFPGSQDFPGHDGFPGQHGFPGPHGSRGHHGFPGQHGFPGPHGSPGHHGFPGHPLPPFLANVTEEALKELRDIMENENLTKAELEAKVKEWGALQGEDVAEKLEELNELRKKHVDEVNKKIAEILKKIETTIEKAKEIRSNMTITRREENKELSDLHKGLHRPLDKIIKLIIYAAKLESKSSANVTAEIPTNLPSAPSSDSSLPAIPVITF